MPEDSSLAVPSATIGPSTETHSAASTGQPADTALIVRKIKKRWERIGSFFQQADHEVKTLVECLSASDRSDVDSSKSGTIAASVWSSVEHGLFESAALNYRLTGDLHLSDHARKGWIPSHMADLTWEQTRTWLESTEVDAKLKEDVLPEHNVEDVVQRLKDLVVYSRAGTTQAASDDSVKSGEGSSSLLIRVLHDPKTHAESQAKEILKSQWDSARRTVDEMGLMHGDRHDTERIPLPPMAWILYDSRLQDKAELERLIAESELEDEAWPFDEAESGEVTGRFQEK